MSEQQARWSMLLSGKSGIRSFTLSGALGLHALNIYIVVTILPHIIGTLGGKRYYSSTESVFFIATLLGAVLVNKALVHLGPRRAYLVACLVFALATFACSLASSMPVFLLARFIQGFGSGLLASLTYSMVRLVFDRPLWPRAMGLIASVWGIATLFGPAIGGFFITYSDWRAAFLFIGGLALVFSLISLTVLPAQTRQASKAAPLPLFQLFLLVALIFILSTGSALDPAWAKTGSLLIGIALLLLLAYAEKHARYRILPQGAFSPGSALFSLYILIMILSFPGIGVETFLPLLLQTLHGMGAILAGYMAVLVSLGWTCGSLASAGANPRRLPSLFAAMPALSIIGLGILLFAIPGTSGISLLFLITVAVALLTVGFGSGIIWPHLLARVLHYSREEDADLASASITLVQLFASALGAALAGTAVNLAGLHQTGSTAETGHAAIALFLFLIIAILAALPSTWHIIRTIGTENHMEKG